MIESPDHFSAARLAILLAALPHAPFDGWSDRLLQRAVKESGVEEGVSLLSFPNGPMDLLEYFWSKIDGDLSAAISQRALHNTHLSQRIAISLRLYIELLRPHREAVRRALALQALPHNAPSAAACLYRTVDTMWRAVGDTSADFSFYTKRASLAAVLGATVTFWLGDDSDDMAVIDAFVGRRIGDIMRFEQVKARAKGIVQLLPSPARILGRLFGHAG